MTKIPMSPQIFIFIFLVTMIVPPFWRFLKATLRNPPKEHENPLEALHWYLQKTPCHKVLQKVRG
jgi:hypothetical protein